MTFEVLVVERDADTVQPQALEERRVVFYEEVFQELKRATSERLCVSVSQCERYLVEEELGLVLPKNACQGGANLILAPGIP